MIDQHTSHMEYQPGMEQIPHQTMEQVLSQMEACDFSSYTPAQVQRALEKDRLKPEDFAALLSPCRRPFPGADGPAGPAGDPSAFWQLGDDVYPSLYCQSL